jgi:hypothetical protein
MLPALTRTGRWSCRSSRPATASSTWTAPSSAPGRGCWTPSASSSPSGWRRGPTSPRSSAATPTIIRMLAEQADGSRGASTRTSGPSGCRSRRATWPPPCAGTWPTTPRRCRTCSGSWCSFGSCRTIWVRPVPGSTRCMRPSPTVTSSGCLPCSGDRSSSADRGHRARRRWDVRLRRPVRPREARRAPPRPALGDRRDRRLLHGVPGNQAEACRLGRIAGAAGAREWRSSCRLPRVDRRAGLAAAA